MIDTGDFYALVGVLIFGLGLHGVLVHAHPLRKILAVNVMGVGVFMLLVASGWRPDGPMDPVRQALVITGIVVAISATALALALTRRLLKPATETAISSEREAKAP